MIKTKTQNKQEKRKENNSSHKILKFLLMPLLSLITIIPNVIAHCPLCTAATIVGVGVTRSLGWDDSIVGVFVGALIVSSALWVNNIFKKRNIGGNAFLRISSIALASFVLTVLSFYFAGLFGPANTYKIFGMERILFGSLSGAIVSFTAFLISNKIKTKNNRNIFC